MGTYPMAAFSHNDMLSVIVAVCMKMLWNFSGAILLGLLVMAYARDYTKSDISGNPGSETSDGSDIQGKGGYDITTHRPSIGRRKG